ncbi:MAG TPA: M35 family metallo-endopeptidase [Stellaceae bacterium]|nr:M35 family metallo-endopeptidase [Stellaceae bacterium]
MPVTFTGFTTDVEKYHAAYNQAKQVLSKAYNSAKSLTTLTDQNRNTSGIKDAQAAFTRFFGGNDPKTVADRLRMMKNALTISDMEIVYDATDPAKAYVNVADCANAPGDPFTAKIQFCKALITGYSVLGTNSSAGTIVHELSHLVLNTDDHIYGMKSCTELDDGDKLTNADNFKYYAELFQLARLSLMPQLSDSYDLKHSPPRS